MSQQSTRSIFLVTILAAVLAVAVLQLPVGAAGADYALQFDGSNDYVTLARAANMMGSDWKTTKTISLWIKPLGPAPVCGHSSPVECDNIFGDRPRWWGIARGSVSGQDRIWVWNWDGNLDKIGIPYNAGEWTHIALVHSGGILRAYRNGIEVARTPSGATQQPSTGALPMLQLGGVINNKNTNWTYEGLIDEVQVWNVARSASDIPQDMNRILDGAEPGLSAYYRMSDGAGLTLTDDSINSWNGLLYDGGGIVAPDGQPPLWVASDVFPEPATPTPTATPTATATPTVTETPADPPTPTATATATATPTVTETPADPPTPTATATATPTSSATPTATPMPSTSTPTPTSTPPAAATIHVGDLDRSAVLGAPGRWSARVTITVHTGGEAARSGVIVSGTWSDGASGTATCTTNTAGLCNISASGLLVDTVPSVKFTVTSLSLAGNAYAPASNHDPDGDSDGTSIVITRP